MFELPNLFRLAARLLRFAAASGRIRSESKSKRSPESKGWGVTPNELVAHLQNASKRDGFKPCMIRLGNLLFEIERIDFKEHRVELVSYDTVRGLKK